MRILLFSDWHAYLTPLPSILQTIAEMSRLEDIDVIIGCGDYTGSKYAPLCIDVILTEIRKIFPATPFGSVLGNHDYWLIDKKRSVKNFDIQNNDIKEVFKMHSVHFFDLDGILRISSGAHNYALVGHSGWYHNPKPRTNDASWMPMFQANTHATMSTLASSQLNDNIALIPANHEVIYVSHFGVVKDELRDWKGGFEEFGGDPNIGTLLQTQYGCKSFLQGHAHTLRQGPITWECGSDYYLPKFQVVEI